MAGLKLNDTLNQEPKVLFDDPNNKHFFAPNHLAEHQRYIEKNDAKRVVSKPLTGDIFRDKNSNYYVLVEMKNLGTFQLTNAPGYNYVDRDYRSYSGSYAFETAEYWTSLDKLVLTGDTDTVKAWSFLDGSAGAHRGIAWSLRVPVWKLKE